MAQKSRGIRRLERERKRTLDQIARLRDGLREEAELATGTDDDAAADAAAEVYEREKILSHIQILEDKVRALDHAISLASEGMYGICEMCGERIPEERLEIVPETTLCVNCASQVEQGIRRQQMQMRPDVRSRVRRPSYDDDDDSDANGADEDG